MKKIVIFNSVDPETFHPKEKVNFFNKFPFFYPEKKFLFKKFKNSYLKNLKIQIKQTETLLPNKGKLSK